MDCIKYLHSFDEVKALVKEVQKRRIFDHTILEHYRGQGRPEYKLLPSLARNLKDGESIDSKEGKLINEFQNQLKAEGHEHVLRIDKTLSDEQNYWNTYTQGQHFGIPSRFLDWSLKWEVGLWFAVQNPNNDDVDGQFWIFSVPHDIHLNDERYCKIDIRNLKQTYFINVPIYWSEEYQDHVAEIKRARQHGKFTISSYDECIVPLEEQKHIFPYFEKYCIPAASKADIRLQLTGLGILDDWLYYRESTEKYGLNKIIQGVIANVG